MTSLIAAFANPRIPVEPSSVHTTSPSPPRPAHRPGHAVQRGADAAVALHLPGGLADRLDDQRDGSLVAIEVSDRQRNALAARGRDHDDELAPPRGPRHARMMDLQRIGEIREILSRDNLESGALVRVHLASTAIP